MQFVVGEREIKKPSWGRPANLANLLFGSARLAAKMLLGWLSACFGDFSPRTIHSCAQIPPFFCLIQSFQSQSPGACCFCCARSVKLFGFLSLIPHCLAFLCRYPFFNSTFYCVALHRWSLIANSMVFFGMRTFHGYCRQHQIARKSFCFEAPTLFWAKFIRLFRFMDCCWVGVKILCCKIGIREYFSNLLA